MKREGHEEKKRDRAGKNALERVREEDVGAVWGGRTRIKPSDEAKSVVARDEVNYIMHMTGGRQCKKQSAGDGGMPLLN